MKEMKDKIKEDLIILGWLVWSVILMVIMVMELGA